MEEEDKDLEGLEDIDEAVMVGVPKPISPATRNLIAREATKLVSGYMILDDDSAGSEEVMLKRLNSVMGSNLLNIAISCGDEQIAKRMLIQARRITKIS